MILFALLGLFVGALLNLVADQVPLRRHLVQPSCPYCGQKFSPWEWLPLLNLVRRCSHCGASLPLRRPLLEVGTTLVFAFLWGYYGPGLQLLLVSFYTCVLLLLLVTDLEHRLIPNPIILPAILIAGVGGSLQRGPLPTLAGGAIGFASFYLIALARKGGMGGGDVKLAAFIGLASGFPAVLVALIAAILLGGVAALILVLTRVRGLKSYIPYGPFLVAGGLLAILYGPQIVTWYLASMAR